MVNVMYKLTRGKL